MKRIATFFLAAVLLFGAVISLPFSASAGSASDFAYEITNGEATVTRYNGPGGDVTVPSTLGGCPVTAIKEWAFSGRDDLTSVKLPKTVRTIGELSFTECSSMTSIEFPEGLTSIGYGAFRECGSLKSIRIPSGVTSIGRAAFQNCGGIESITVAAGNPAYKAGGNCLIEKETGVLIAGCANSVIPEGVTSIGNSAFSGRTGLTSIRLPDSVTSIQGFAFDSCENLVSINIPKGVTEIGNWAFAYCRGLASIEMPDSVTTFGEGAFLYCDKLTSFVIPEGVTKIPNNMFDYCYEMTSVSIPSTVTSIGDNAFLFCRKLTSVKLPEGVTTIGEFAFRYCYGLNSINIPSGVTKIGRYAFDSCPLTGTIRIPDGVTRIEDSTFSGCTALTGIELPEGLTYIGESAFFACESLKGIVIPDGVEEIGESAFYYCYDLKDVTLGSGLKALGKFAFDTCTSLTDIYIPEGVTSIGNCAFRDCTSLERIRLPESVTFIGSCAYQNCSNVQGVLEIPAALTEIEAGAFVGCSGVTGITAAAENPKYYDSGNCLIEKDTNVLVLGCKNSVIPSGVTEIGMTAFAYCNKLTNVVIPEGVTVIGPYAFYRCTGLKTVVIPEGVTTISSEAFSGCTGLTSIDLPESVTDIGGYAFYNCRGVKRIAIPSGVTRIWDYTFCDCYGLTTVELPDSVTYIGDLAFYYCHNLKNINIPDGVTEIGKTAFYSCSALKRIEIPASVDVIEALAFSRCSSLTDIYCLAPKKPEGWDDNWLGDCKATVHWGTAMPEVPETPSEPDKPFTPSEDLDLDVRLTQGSNREAQNYTYWSAPVRSNLVETANGEWMRVQSVNGDTRYFVEYYDKEYHLLRAFAVRGELPLFGGFYATESNYYILSGQNNPNESPDVECFRITKYDLNWSRLDSVGLYDCNTYTPFYSGSARMTHSGDMLLIRTCHEMYKTPDGYHHQANVTIQVDTDAMVITDSFTDILNSSVGYVSHSFNQFIREDNDHIVAVDHGDAHPRSIALIRYPTKVSSGRFFSWNCEVTELVKFAGSEGDNCTGASVGGFEISDSSYLVAYNSVPQDGKFASYGTRNLYVVAMDKESGEVTNRQITDYAEGTETVSTPHLVKLGEASFLLLWSRGGRVCFVKLNGKGETVGEIHSMESAYLSDCAPIAANGKLVWYTFERGTVTFYEIDTEDLSRNRKVTFSSNDNPGNNPGNDNPGNNPGNNPGGNDDPGSIPTILGDLGGDGVIDATDYLLLKRCCLGTFELSAAQRAVADINRDGAVDALDYIQLKRYVLGTFVIG